MVSAAVRISIQTVHRAVLGLVEKVLPYNFIGQFDLPLSEKEIAEARQKAEQEAAEKAKRKKNRQRESNVAHQAKAKAERWAANDGHKYPKRICEQCGKEFYDRRAVCLGVD